MGLGSSAPQVDTDLWRSAIVRSPYGAIDASHNECPSCGSAGMQLVAFRDACAADEGFSYVFTGGMNANLLTLSWSNETPDPVFIVLKTFTGLQTRPRPRGRSVAFPLADEDAYCYCDLDPCEWCVARCKRGFKLYVACSDGKGLRFSCEQPPTAAATPDAIPSPQTRSRNDARFHHGPSQAETPGEPR